MNKSVKRSLTKLRNALQ